MELTRLSQVVPASVAAIDHHSINRGEVTPEVAQAIPAGRDLLLELILGERVEEGLDPVGVELPCEGPSR
jgi:hypothetical protein